MDPKEKLTKIKGKDYLEVKWRIVWFREDHPEGTIATEVLSFDPPLMRATASANGIILGTGIGSPKKGIALGRPFEGAETAAIGRALAHAGYGTQFTAEDEGEHLADSPVESKAHTLEKRDQVKPKSIYDAIVEAKLAMNVHSAKNALQKCSTGYETPEKAMKWMNYYRGWRDIGKDSDEAARLANQGKEPI